MGDPISPYLTKKLNLNYESSTVAIQEAIKAGDKKKGVTPFRAKDSSSSRIAALRSLLFYSPAQAITENMKSLITHSDKVTQRLAYYHLNTQKVALQDREAALKSFQTEMNEKSVARRLHCLRTFSHLVEPDSPTAREIVKFSQEIMEPPQAASKKDAKKAAGKDLVTRQILQSGALLALRQLELPQFPPAMLPNLITLIESGEYPVSVRHALALIKQCAQNEKDPSQIAEMMRRFLPNTPPAQSIPKSRLAEDAQARMYMVQLFALFAETQNNNGLDVDYYEGLSHMIWDLSPRVAFEAIHGLARLGWSRMHNHRVGIRENIEYLHPVEETETVKRLLFRLIGELKDHLTKSRKSQCVVHATLRAIIVVGQTYVSSPEAQKDEVNPLNPLFGPLKAHLANCQDNIRLQILTAFVWITQHYNEKLISNILEKQMQQDNITPAMYESLLTSLHQRVLVTPNMSSMALRLVHIIGTRRPDKAPAMPMAQLWNSIIRVAPEGREMVQQSLFQMLDHHRSVEDHVPMQEVHRLCYYVLGREALRITTRENKATMNSAHLRSIILRLEHAAANDSWEVRNICLDGLVKIAVGTTAIDVRQQILSFFQSFPYSWSIFQKEASLVLGDVVDFHNRWEDVRVKNDTQQLSKDQKKQRDAEGAQLIKMISFFAQEEIVLFDDDE